MRASDFILKISLNTLVSRTFCLYLPVIKKIHMTGKKLVTLSQNIFKDCAENAINKQPIRKEVYLAEIELLSKDKIGYKGSEIAMSKEAFSDLLKILNIPQAFINRFSEMMAEKPQARQQFINTVKNVMSNRGSGSSSVSLVLSKESKQIIAIHKNVRNLISNAGMLDVVSKVVNDNNLSVVDFSVSNNGEVVINTVDQKSEWGIDGLKDEVFTGGVSFVNNPKNGFIISPYVNRLVCANGMVTRGFGEQFKLTSVSGNEMQKFFSDLANLAKTGYRPEKFVERVEEAHELKASLAEMYKVKAAIKNAVPDITKEELENWVPLIYTENAYKRIGIEPHLLRQAQLKNARTDTSVWDLINGLTHFATHNNGFNNISEYERRRLQMEAGRLLTDDHDMANFVRCPFMTNGEYVQAKNAY